jgi:PKD domain/FG-GAP-like repeat
MRTSYKNRQGVVHLRSRKECVRFAALIWFVTSVAACGGGGRGGQAVNHAPVADAGVAQTSAKRAVVTLDGSASRDPDGNSLSYAWSQTAGPTVTLSNPNSAKPTFTAPGISGTLSFSLTVNDGQINSAPSAVSVSITNAAPTASAGVDITVATNAAVTLDGTASSDPDSDPITYTWAQTAGSPVTLDTSVAGRATFVAPSAAGVLKFSLVVNDGEVDSPPATVTVTVAPVSTVPTASAGADITTPKRSLVVLQGTGSDPQGKPLTYQWQQTAGATVALQNAGTAGPQFTAPATVGDLQFALTVNNGVVTSPPSTVTVHVQNFAPVISTIALSNPSPKRNDAISVLVTSYDADSDPLTLSYVWKRNGTVVPTATTAAYPTGNQVKNDVISVTVTVSDGIATGTASTNATIADTSPTLAGTAPTSVTYGHALSFQLTASDVDGDPTGPLEVAYGPAGFSVSAAGLVTWTPSGPLFERATDMAWQIRLHNAPQISIGGKITVNDSARSYPLARTNAGIPVGNNAIDVEDFDGNGKKEILIGTYTGLYILEQNGASDYAQSWVYPYDPAADGNVVSGASTAFAAVTSGDVNGDGHREIFFSQGPVIVELDGITRREVARYGNQGSAATAPLGPYCTALKYADIDNDGAGELVCLGSSGGYGAATQLFVLDARTMTLKWQSGVLNGGTSMAIGNVDGDPALEIVTSDGFVFDGATHQNQWQYGPGFGSVVDVGDVNGDGIGRIVGIDSTTGVVKVFSATLKSPIWQISSSIGGTSAIKVANLDGVGPAEILVGDGQWGNVTVYRYDATSNAASIVSQTNSLGDGVSAIAVGDVDGDGQMEMIWGSDFVSSGPDTLAIASWTSTPVVKWKGPDGAQLDGPFVGAKSATVASGQNRLMFVTPSTNNAYAGMRVIGMDPSTGLLALSNEVDSNWSRDAGFDVANVYGGSLDSMLLGTATLYTGYFTAYDFAGNTKSWTSGNVGDGVAVTHADLNHDSVPDVIGITTQGYVYAWDVLHQTLLWTSTQLTGGKDVAAVDLDGDGQAEIIALAQNRVVVYKYSSVASGYLEAYTYLIGGTDLLVADTDGDGVPEIFVLNGYNNGSGDGSITQFNSSLQVLHQYVVPYANSLYLEESGFARKNLVVDTMNSALFYSTASKINIVDPTTGTTIWQSPYVSGSVPINSLSFHDFSRSGQLQMAFGTTENMYLTR